MAVRLTKLTRNGRPLSDYDIEFILDRSGSMSTSDRSTKGVSRWESGRKLLVETATACQEIDDDGISIVFFDDEIVTKENTTLEVLHDVFKRISPRSSTDTAGAIGSRLNAYFSRRDGETTTKKTGGLFGFGGKTSTETKPAAARVKPVIMLVYTDGVPNSQSRLEDVIIAATKKMQSKDEIGICFIQAGNDASAKQFLLELDTNLESRGAKFDIVSCITVDEAMQLNNEQLLTFALTGVMPQLS